MRTNDPSLVQRSYPSYASIIQHVAAAGLCMTLTYRTVHPSSCQSCSPGYEPCSHAPLWKQLGCRNRPWSAGAHLMFTSPRNQLHRGYTHRKVSDQIMAIPRPLRVECVANLHTTRSDLSMLGSIPRRTDTRDVHLSAASPSSPQYTPSHRSVRTLQQSSSQYRTRLR